MGLDHIIGIPEVINVNALITLCTKNGKFPSVQTYRPGDVATLLGTQDTEHNMTTVALIGEYLQFESLLVIKMCIGSGKQLLIEILNDFLILYLIDDCFCVCLHKRIGNIPCEAIFF